MQFFKEEISYLVHWVSKVGVWPSNSSLDAVTECTLPQTYAEVCAFLSLVGHYRRFFKGFACIAQSLSQYLVGEGATRKPWWAFEVLKQVCMTAPLLAFADYTKPFLLEPDASKDGLGQCYHGSRLTNGITLLPMASGPLHLMRRTTTQLNLSFWHWSGQLWGTSRSTCPTSLSWWQWITICWHTYCQHLT